MNILPNAAVVAVAGTAVAQQRGTDTETVKSQQAALNQREAPGQSEGADQLTLDPSGKSGDRDADGRRQHERPQHDSETTGSSAEAEADPVDIKPIDEDCGAQLDLEA